MEKVLGSLVVLPECYLAKFEFLSLRLSSIPMYTSISVEFEEALIGIILYNDWIKLLVVFSKTKRVLSTQRAILFFKTVYVWINLSNLIATTAILDVCPLYFLIASLIKKSMGVFFKNVFPSSVLKRLAFLFRDYFRENLSSVDCVCFLTAPPTTFDRSINHKKILLHPPLPFISFSIFY